MQRIKLTDRQILLKSKVIATIGNFDGVHCGHLELLRELDVLATTVSSAYRILITFDVLPHEYFADKSGVARAPRIGLLRDKIDAIKASALIDEVVILHFNHYMANMDAESFINKVLINHLQIKMMLVGHDFHFGKSAKGSYLDLQKSGILTQQFTEIRHNQQRISSSLIRRLAAEQKIELIRYYLGRNIRYTSRVVYGNQLGRKYGVPTINLNLGKIRPVLWGIYTGYVYIDNKRYNSVISIGKNPTVCSEEIYKVEAHLLDVNLTLYGKIATVEILHYLRPELKFEGLDRLFEQIHKDMHEARVFFKAL